MNEVKNVKERPSLEEMQLSGKLPKREFCYELNNVCAVAVAFDIVENRLHKVFIHLGCEGNRAAIAKLLEGMTIDEAILRLKGIKCNGSQTKTTSCGDAIARCLIKHKRNNQKLTPEEQLVQLQGQVGHLTDVVLALEGSLKVMVEMVGNIRK